MNSILELRGVERPKNDYQMFQISKKDFSLNKFFYKQIGKNYRWIDRLEWTDKKWIEYVNSKQVSSFVLKQNDNPIGFFELIFHECKNEIEIAYFGILEEYFNKKLGGLLLTEAIKISFLLKIKRVWVHTCSLDHENALKNYIARGMKVFKSETINY